MEGGRAGSGSGLWLLTPVSWTYRGITVTTSREEWGHCELCRCDVCICCPTSLLYSGRHYVQQEISVGFHARPVYVRSWTLSLFQFLCRMSKRIWTFYFLWMTSAAKVQTFQLFILWLRCCCLKKKLWINLVDFFVIVDKLVQHDNYRKSDLISKCDFTSCVKPSEKTTSGPSDQIDVSP